MEYVKKKQEENLVRHSLEELQDQQMFLQRDNDNYLLKVEQLKAAKQ